ncbi:LysE family translocator [Salipiger sp. P9]|uniref:LysE family translocator n=1 Tax=Salipiger pentaromativorans TaxID=2943193 RepID=UPI00215778AD|nr:LysE family translocator [Salipiger pentaromativorans]MCR8550366.1 LysE family translocator [Salipiger pentaromativorans]
MTLPTIAALLLFLLPLAWSPGPGNMSFAANGARFGLRATLPASLGYHLATWSVTVALGLGATAVLERFPGLFDALRWGGAGYVLWLAWTMARASALSGENRATALGFGGGAILLLLNPKAYVIIALMLSQFLGDRPHLPDLVALATVFTLNNLVAFTAWTAAGDRLARRFRDPAQARRLNRLFAGALGLCGGLDAAGIATRRYGFISRSAFLRTSTERRSCMASSSASVTASS